MSDHDMSGAAYAQERAETERDRLRIKPMNGIGQPASAVCTVMAGMTNPGNTTRMPGQPRRRFEVMVMSDAQTPLERMQDKMFVTATLIGYWGLERYVKSQTSPWDVFFGWLDDDLGREMMDALHSGELVLALPDDVAVQQVAEWRANYEAAMRREHRAAIRASERWQLLRDVYYVLEERAADLDITARVRAHCWPEERSDE